MISSAQEAGVGTSAVREARLPSVGASTGSTLPRAKLMVTWRSLHGSHLATCENYEKLKLTGDDHPLEMWVEEAEKQRTEML